MYKFSVLLTLLTIFPYLLIYICYYIRNKDSFFLRNPSYRKIDLYIGFIAITILQFIVWHSYTSENLFLGLKISEETEFFNDKFITFLGINSAIIGWLYTVRMQNITNMRNRSIQSITDARLSEQYNQKFDSIYELLKYQKTLTNKKYITFNSYEKSIVHYILNYYEFIAIGIKYSELDEEIVKKMMKSQVLKTYTTFEDVINNLQKNSPTVFENFVDLKIRWEKTNNQRESKHIANL